LSAHVEILVGSKSDLPYLKESSLTEELKRQGVSYAVSVCSAHRNSKELAERIDQTIDHTGAYVCAAGWAAALPGAVKALLLGRSLASVYGIALPSEDYPNGEDAAISIQRLPPGIDVVFGGVSIDGFDKIAPSVIADARSFDPNANLNELQAIRDKIKPPQFDINLEEV